MPSVRQCDGVQGDFSFGDPITGTFFDTTSADFPSEVQPGDALVVVFKWGSADSLTGITDTYGNSYSKLAGIVAASGSAQAIEIWVATNVAGVISATTKLTLSFEYSGSEPGIYSIGVYDCVGINGAPVVSNTKDESGSTVSSITGPALSAGAHIALFIAATNIGVGASATVDSPWVFYSTPSTDTPLAVQIASLVSGGNQSPTFNEVGGGVQNPILAEVAFQTTDPFPQPEITTTSLPNGAANAPYTATLAATGGTPGYTWSLLSGSLPTGLSLNSSTGVISGTPTADNLYSFTIQVSDSNNQTAQAAYSIGVGDLFGSWPMYANQFLEDRRR
jgi:hypothetical protein